MITKGPRKGGKCQILVSDRASRGLIVVWTCYFCAKIVTSFPLSIGLVIDDFFTIRNAHWIFFSFIQFVSISHSHSGDSVCEYYSREEYFADFFYRGPIANCKQNRLLFGQYWGKMEIYFCIFVNKIVYYLANAYWKRKYISYGIIACSKGKKCWLPRSETTI